jgi:hypothetical protein
MAGGGEIDQQDVNVVVFGAGITGLTVAQELAERRFKVWVVEPTFDVNRHGQWAQAIGGMARTQYAAVDETGAATAMAISHVPLARVAMHVPLTFPLNELTEIPPHVEKYIRQLESPAAYGGGVLLQFLSAGSRPLLRDLGRLLAQRHWTNDHWKAILYKQPTKYPATDSSVTLIRRARSVCIGQPDGQLSRTGARMLEEFLDYTSPGDAVRLIHADQTAPPALMALLEAHHLRVRSVGRRNLDLKEKPSGVRLATVRDEIPLYFHRDGVLTQEAVRILENLQSSLVSGDVIEIHHPLNTLKAVKATNRIKEMLSGASVTVLVPRASALILPTPTYLSTFCLVPGEHGFRFFPSYYRHLRNTLRRVPTFKYDDRQIPQLTTRESGETVLDNLVNTPVQALAGIGTNPLLYPRAPTPSVGAIAHQLKSVLLEREYDPRDIGQFIIRVLRYMSTGSKRRALELNRISWWQYLRGYDPMTGTYRFRYSDEFARDLGESPRVLAAFDAEWGDAHTNGNTFVQLLLNQFLETEDVDQVLNAPTSEAWFEHWEQYLREQLEVRFVAASLEGLSEGTPGSRRVAATLRSMITGELVKLGQPGVVGDSTAQVRDPDLVGLNSAIMGNSPHYFVMAVDAKTAEAATANLPSHLRIGVATEIQGFERVVRGSPLGDEPPHPRPDLKYGARPWDRFQTLTGIQFFFRNVTGIFDGHVYYMDAPWALSSINQQQFWRISLISRHAPYRGLLSADIGRFTDAWEGTPQAVADDTWKQIRNALKRYWESDRVDTRINSFFPTWFHIDRTVNLAGKINNSPYLIPIVDDWQNRPTDVLFDPGEGLDAPVAPPGDPNLLWWALWGGYRVHWGEWLFAGTYMRHFTRMTTMEAANESGRHAVNAILDHVLPATTMNLPAGFTPRRRYSTAGNPLEPRTAYIPTPSGDYCHIWDMENYELADLVHLRELDDWLVDQGLPHVCDLVGGEVIPSMVSYLPSASELGLPTAADIIRVLTPPFESPGFQWPLGGINIPGPGSWPWPK